MQNMVAKQIKSGQLSSVWDVLLSLS